MGSVGKEVVLEPDVYHMGPGTMRISRSKLHGPIRRNVIQAMKAAFPADKLGFILLQGGDAWGMYSSDTELVFRQEAFFHYLFGVEEEGWYGALDVNTGSTTLFMPRLPDSYAVWMGEIKGPEHYRSVYAVDEVVYVDELLETLKAAKPPVVHLLVGTQTDSGNAAREARVEGLADAFTLERDVLFNVLSECRVHKTPEEVEIIRYANRIGSAGHIAMMKAVRPGVMEYQLESLFLHTCYARGGCRHALYTPIGASGPNGAVLHYGHAGAPNDREIKAGDLLLLDMGCEYYRYGSDITTSFPSVAPYSPDQAAVYNAVLRAHTEIIAAMKPGVAWPDMHTLAFVCILEGLRDAGFVRGDIQEMIDADVGALFMPHGLGHLLGKDVHDAGGYLEGFPERPKRPGYKNLRTARLLEAGMCITVEPGCYFNSALLRPAFESPAQSQFLVRERVEQQIDFGGVRIEDNVLVTETGSESLTHVPRKVEEVEAIIGTQPLTWDD